MNVVKRTYRPVARICISHGQLFKIYEFRNALNRASLLSFRRRAFFPSVAAASSTKNKFCKRHGWHPFSPIAPTFAVNAARYIRICVCLYVYMCICVVLYCFLRYYISRNQKYEEELLKSFQSRINKWLF